MSNDEGLAYAEVDARKNGLAYVEVELTGAETNTRKQELTYA